MAELKLCPMNRMSECVKEKCAWWVNEVKVEGEVEGRVISVSQEIGTCAVTEISRSHSIQSRHDELSHKLVGILNQKTMAEGQG